VSTQAEQLGWKFVGKNLGKGGQGDVELVERLSEPGGQRFAFKFLGERGGPRAHERFRQELEALAKVNHPGIVKVVDYAKTADAMQYYVMEYVQGANSLRQRIAQKVNPFFRDPLKSVEGFIQIVDALAECEVAGIVHRDLSPANVLVTDEGRVILIDFGLCQIEGGNRLTLTEEAVGTPHYRPPECSGHSSLPVTIKADLYSAGKILWSMVTNKAAFDREEPVFNHLALNNVLPEDFMTWHLHHIFARTIRKNPDDRYMAAASARAHAKQIRDIMKAGTLPLEKLISDRLCPLCKLGRLCMTESLARDTTLVDHATVKQFVPDQEMLGYLQGARIPYDSRILTCSYCGFTGYFNEVVQDRNVQKRKTLS
jgi:serine/threonine protein kinase